MDERRTWVPWVLILALLVLSAGAAVLSVTTTPRPPVTGASNLPIPSTPFTGFGGYHTNEVTNSISAQWVVPTIVGRRRDVSAATWVGAQSLTDNVFVQVGVTERWSSTTRPDYEAFWSDAPLLFEEQPIRAVGAGDSVIASMNHTATGWVLEIEDLTKNWSQLVPTGYQGGAPFSEGEWLQEDPPPSLHTANDLPYPQTTVVRFTDMQINGRTPSLPFTDGQALSGFGGIYLVPTAVANGSFSLPPAHGPARQYLADAAAFDTRLEATGNSVDQQHTPLTAAQKRQLDAELIAAFRQLATTLTDQSWPAALLSDTGQLAAAADAIIADDEQAETKNVALSSPVARAYVHHLTRFHALVEDIRSRLGIPPI